MRFALFAMLVIALIGTFIWSSSGLSHFGTPPDPNDQRQAGILTPEVLRQILKGYSDTLVARLQDSGGVVDDAEFKTYMAQATNSLLDQVNIEHVSPDKAWEYGEIYVTAQRWKDAKRVEQIAVKAAKNEDRRVNDSLRLARVFAELGEVPEAIKTARTTFNTPDQAAAPILLAVLLEIVPAAQGKGHDPELGALLEDAIKCEKRTIVDPSTLPGQAFLAARPHHVDNAWSKAIELYEDAGKTVEARAAYKREVDMRNQQGSA